MSVLLGSDWQRPILPVIDPTDDMLGKVLLAVQALQETFAQLPAPQINLEPADFTDIVTAVQDLKGPAGPSADDIAQAIKDVLVPPTAPVVEDVVSPKLLAALEKLDFRLRGTGAVGGAGSLSLPDDANRLLGHVTVDAAAGTFGYTAGVSGTETLSGGKRVANLSVHCTTAGSVTINAGATIPIPANSQFSATYPDGKLVDPTLVMTGSDSYYIDWLS